ncbi:MAG: phosphodiesterase [Chitinophagaceae bacterium]|nr:phosphodiesterase [Chitinophagaceae bacterium]
MLTSVNNLQKQPLNLLAHAYLSFGQPEITVGNLISDFVKGKKQYDYPAGIQKGITLHRHIDSFTDASEPTRNAKEIFRPAYRLYSGALTDIVYDHFLANDENEFPPGSLFRFSQQVYAVLEQYHSWLPPDFARMFPYMKSQNWLYNYHTKPGIEKSLRGLVHRSVYLTESDTAFLLFEQHYELLKACYDQLIIAIKPYAKQRLEELLAS